MTIVLLDIQAQVFEAKGTACSFKVNMLCLPANIHLFAQTSSWLEIRSSQLLFVKILSHP